MTEGFTVFELRPSKCPQNPAPEKFKVFARPFFSGRRSHTCRWRAPRERGRSEHNGAEHLVNHFQVPNRRDWLVDLRRTYPGADATRLSSCSAFRFPHYFTRLPKCRSVQSALIWKIGRKNPLSDVSPTKRYPVQRSCERGVSKRNSGAWGTKGGKGPRLESRPLNAESRILLRRFAAAHAACPLCLESGGRAARR